MTQPLKHAKFIHAWADGEDVQYLDDYISEWILIGESHVRCDDNEYRLKPKMIRCGDMEFPEPMRVAPEIGTKYWVTSLTGPQPHYMSWSGTVGEQRYLKSGICHATQEAAKAHAKALIALTEVKP